MHQEQRRLLLSTGIGDEERAVVREAEAFQERRYLATVEMKRMLAGDVSDLNFVRRYLDGVRGGGWN